MRRIQYILILVLLTVVHWDVYAAKWQVPVTNFTPAQYSAGMQNWQIVQGENGWLYAANNYGLLEFDGSSWQLYGIWNSTSVRSLCVDGERIYVGATNDFGFFSRDRLGGWVYESLANRLPESERDFGEVWSICQVLDYVYFQTPHAIYRLSPNDQIITIPSAAHIYCCAVHNDALYIASSDGIALLSGTNLVALYSSSILEGSEVRSLVTINSDSLLIGTDFHGLLVLHDNIITPFHTDVDETLNKSQLYALAVRSGQIAIGTVQDGVIVMDANGHDCRYITREDGLQNSTVLSLHFDADGDLWAGLDQGIDHIRLSSPHHQLMDGNRFYGAGYVAQDYAGSLYLGTNQGLYRLTHFSPENPGELAESEIEMVKGSTGQVWSLAVVDGKLLCCHHRGLYEVREEGLYPLSETTGFWRLRQLDDHRWIAGTYRGFCLLEDGVCTPLRGVQETALNWELDKQGSVWLCSLHGLLRLQLSDLADELRTTLLFQDTVPHDFVGIMRLADTVLVTSDNFAFKVDAQGDTYSTYSMEYALGNVHYTLGQQDEDGVNWYMTEDGLFTQSQGHQPQVLIHHPASIPGFANLLCLGGGKAIAGGLNGFYLLNNAGASRQIAPKVFIRRMAILLPGEDSLLYGEAHWCDTSCVVLPSDEYSLRFTLATSESCGREVRYRSYISPIEKGFSTWTSSPVREVRTLNHGQYVLHVEALVDGVIVEREFEFTIEAPWYLTRVAYVLYGVGVLLLIAGIVWRVRRKLLHDRKEYERMRQEEQREHKMRILELENEKKEMEIQSKSQELSNLLLNQINRNELADEVMGDLQRIIDDLQTNHREEALKRLRHLSERVGKNRINTIDWEEFEKNFDVVNANFLKKLAQLYPWMTPAEKKLCVYIKMGLQTKEIAPLLGQTTRGAEMLRYRMRQKMELNPQANLKEVFENLQTDE